MVNILLNRGAFYCLNYFGYITNSRKYTILAANTLYEGLGTPTLAALTVIAIGAGAMTVSHANDSYFWVVTNFGEMKVEDGYKTQTFGTFLIGIASIINAYIVYFIVR